MKCVVCHGGDIKQKEVTEEIKTDGNIVLLPITRL